MLWESQSYETTNEDPTPRYYQVVAIAQASPEA